MSSLPDPLSTTFAALADPTRRAILARLAQGAATVGELSQPFSISSPAISKHLKVLERAGLITRGRDAQWRPCQLRTVPLEAAASWIDEYRKFWSESFDRLTEYLLADSPPSPPSKKGSPHARRKRNRR
jgi:DNA-binding transcriptional ArsR family regulator